MQEITTNKRFNVYRLGNGWYSFKELPQEHRYIKIEALCCGTDKKAMKTASNILGTINNGDAIVISDASA